jgi:hypothetical protein
MINFCLFKFLRKVSFSALFFLSVFSAILDTEKIHAQQPDCKPVWTNAAMGLRTGYSMVSKDVDGDGKVEIICGGVIDILFANIWYVLEYNPMLQSYNQVWTSSYYESGESISLIDALDVDGDGDTEIVIGTYSGLVQFFDGATRQLERQIQLPENIQRILLADADNDNAIDLVIGTFQNTYLYDPGNFNPKLIIPYGDLDMECGNVDAEPSLELVYAPGKVIRIMKDSTIVVWENNYTVLGWVELADIDSDGMQEIIFAEREDDVHVYDADLKIHKYAIETSSYYYSFHVADVTGDGISEILVSQSDGVWGGIYCYNAETSEELWRVYNPECGSMNMNVANTDWDDAPELVWAGACRLSGYSELYIYDISTQSMEWKSNYNPLPYFSVGIQNIDGDEAKELVMLSNRYEDGLGKTRLSVFSAWEHSPQWFWDTCFNSTGYCGFQLSDIDNDDKTEIVLAGGSDNSRGYISVRDPLHQVVKSSHIFDDLQSFYTIGVGDLDNNGTKEYVVSTKSQIHIVNPIDYSIEWSSDEFFKYVYDTAKLIIGNIDSDANPEILFLKGSILFIDGLTHESWETQEKNFRSFCLFDYDHNNIDDIIAGNAEGRICIIDGITRLVTWLPINMPDPVNAICLSDITGNGSPEIVFTSGGMAHFSDINGSLISTSKIGDIKGDHDFIRITDNNNDGYKEVLVATCYQVVEFGYDCYRAVGIPADIKANKWTVYPNPSCNFIYLEFENDFSGKNATLEVLSIQGVSVIRQVLAENKKLVDISNLAKGVYFVKVMQDGYQTVTRIVKE